MAGVELHHGLHAVRGLGTVARIGTLIGIFHPVICALIAWTLYAGLIGAQHAAASAPPDVRIIRAECTLTPSDQAQGLYRNWGTCQPGQGAELMRTTYSYQRIADVALIASWWARLAGSIFTVGALFLGVTGIAGRVNLRRARRPSRIMAAGRRVAAENRRARDDVAQVRRVRGRWATRRRRKVEAREAAAALAGVALKRRSWRDRWAFKHGDANKPPKGARKAKRTAKKSKRSDKRAEKAYDADRKKTWPTGDPDYEPPFSDPPPFPPGYTPGPSAERLEQDERARRGEERGRAHVRDIERQAAARNAARAYFEDPAAYSPPDPPRAPVGADR